MSLSKARPIVLRGHPDCEGFEAETADDFFDKQGYLPQFDFDKVTGKETFKLGEIVSHRSVFDVRFKATGEFEGDGEKRREIFRFSEILNERKWLPEDS